MWFRVLALKNLPRHTAGMSRLSLSLAGGLLLFAALGSWQLLAQEESNRSHTLSVSAIILDKNNCKFSNNGPTALSFGSIDPSGEGRRISSASATFKCSGASANPNYYVTSDDGLNPARPGAPRLRNVNNPNEFIEYSLNVPLSGTARRARFETFNIEGAIEPSAYKNASAGNYADTVTLTIQP